MKLAEELRVLANAHEENGEYEIARDLYRRALKAQMRTAGADSPQLIPYIYDLAMVSAALEDESECRRLCARLLALAPYDREIVREVNAMLGELAVVLSAA